MGNINNCFLNHITWQNTAGQQVEMSDGMVHVWRISISSNQAMPCALQNLLNSAEVQRAAKYKQEKDRQRFIISRAGQRIILGRYLQTPPASLEFILGDNKKPYLLNDAGEELHYNLSHSGNWILLAVAASPVGADVEFIDHAFTYRDILPDNFSTSEAAYINRENSVERFFTLWTRKEAILKATGQGLGDHLPLTPALDGKYMLQHQLLGSNKNWQLNSFNVYDGYVGTVVAHDTAQQYNFFDAGLL